MSAMHKVLDAERQAQLSADPVEHGTDALEKAVLRAIRINRSSGVYGATLRRTYPEYKTEAALQAGEACEPDAGLMPLIDDYAKAVHDGDDDACVVLREVIHASLEQMVDVHASQPMSREGMSEPLPEHADHVSEIASRLRLVAKLAGCSQAVPEDDYTAVAAIFSVLGDMRRAMERSGSGEGGA